MQVTSIARRRARNRLRAHRSAVRLLLLPLLAVGGLASTLACANDAAKPGRGVDGSHVIAFTTGSGMRVELLAQEGSGLIASNVFVGSGSTREADSNAGSSHFLEHLLFNGTTSRTQEELYAEVDRIGAYNNATTRQEYTHFMMVAAREHLQHALEIQSDMLLNSTLPPEKFEKERGIVVEELRKDQDSANYLRQRAMAEASYSLDNPYRRAVLGSAATIESLDREQVLAYYHAQYAPQNMRLLLMGDFDPQAAREMIEELYPSRAATPAPAPEQMPLRAGQLHTRHLEDEAMSYALRLPAPAADSPDLAAFRILTAVLAEGESSRIGAALAAANLAPHQFGASIQYQQGLSTLELSGQFDPDTAPDAVTRVVLGELATLGQNSIRAAEWAPARTSLLSESIRRLSQLHYYALFEGDRIWHGGAAAEEQYQRGLESSYEYLAEVAGRWFAEPTIEITCLGPQLPDSDRSFDAVESGLVARPMEGETSELPGQGRAPDDRPLAATPQAATVTTLDNGMMVIHRAVPATRMLGLHLWVRDRSAREPDGREGIADLLHRCLPLGAGAYDRTEFDALIRGIGAELKVTDSAYIPYDDYYTTPRFSFVRLDCVDIYWREAIRTLALMIQEPRLEESAVEEKLAEMQRRRAADSKSSRHLADLRFRRELLGDHPLAHDVYGSDASLAGVDPKELQGFALDYLDPGQLVLSVVGNLDHDAIVAALESAFSKSRSDGRGILESVPWPITTEERQVEIEVGGQQSTLRAGRVFEIDTADRWALQAATRMLSLRMQQEIREVRGLAYSLGMSVSFDHDRAWLDASVGTQPQNLDEVRDLTRGFLNAKGEPFTEDELEVAVNGYVGRVRMRQVTPLGQAYTLARDFVVEGSLDATEVEGRELAAVSLDDVSRVVKTYLTVQDAAPHPTVWVLAR